jgi:hypothetical protein
MNENIEQTQKKVNDGDQRKPYQKPQIIHEFVLETRAGSPIPPTFNPISGPGF